VKNEKFIASIKAFIEKLEPFIIDWDLYTHRYDILGQDRYFDRKCKLEDLFDSNRCAELILLKHSIMYILYSNFKGCIRYKDLALAFNLKNHTTIINAIQNIENYLEIKDPATVSCINGLNLYIAENNLLDAKDLCI
jgi:hypothetical protein